MRLKRGGRSSAPVVVAANATTSAAAITMALLAACTGAPPAPVSSRHGAPSPPAAAPDGVDDWRQLVPMPFGTLLKSSPVALHEVLLFHAPDSQETGGDCYGVDRGAPRLAGKAADDYRLCFSHDRLNRIEAGVRLPPAEAPALFARVCARWLTGSAPVEGSGDLCAGSDHGVSWRARLSRSDSETFELMSVMVTAASEEAEPDAAAPVP